MKYRLGIKFVFILLYMSCALLLIKGEEIMLVAERGSHLIYMAKSSKGGFSGHRHKNNAIHFRKIIVPNECVPDTALLKDGNQLTMQNTKYGAINYIRLQMVNKKDTSLSNNDGTQRYLSYRKKISGKSTNEHLWELHHKAITDDSSETCTVDSSNTGTVFVELQFPHLQLKENEHPYYKLIPYVSGRALGPEKGPFLTLLLPSGDLSTDGEMTMSSFTILDGKAQNNPDSAFSTVNPLELQMFYYLPASESSN